MEKRNLLEIIELGQGGDPESLKYPGILDIDSIENVITTKESPGNFSVSIWHKSMGGVTFTFMSHDEMLRCYQFIRDILTDQGNKHSGSFINGSYVFKEKKID